MAQVDIDGLGTSRAIRELHLRCGPQARRPSSSHDPIPTVTRSTSRIHAQYQTAKTTVRDRRRRSGAEGRQPARTPDATDATKLSPAAALVQQMLKLYHVSPANHRGVNLASFSAPAQPPLDSPPLDGPPAGLRSPPARRPRTRPTRVTAFEPEWVRPIPAPSTLFSPRVPSKKQPRGRRS